MKTDGEEYRVGDVAKLLAVSDQSVRAWSNEFAALLGPGAAPARNVERRYTGQDVRALVFIRDRRRLREAPDVVSEALQEAIQADDLPPLPESPFVGNVPAEIVTAARGNWLAERAGLDTTIERLEAEKDALAAQLADEQAGRRADVERLTRELGTLQAELAEAQTMARLYESGRLRPQDKP